MPSQPQQPSRGVHRQCRHVAEEGSQGDQEHRWMGEARAPRCHCTPEERRRVKALSRAWGLHKPRPWIMLRAP